MSRRNRFALESSPLPSLPEVDTSSTIDATAKPRITKSLKQVPPDVADQRYTVSGAQSAPVVAKFNPVMPCSLSAGIQSLSGVNIPLVEFAPSIANEQKGVASSVDEDNDTSNNISSNNHSDDKRTVKPPSFFDDIRTTFVRGFSSRGNERVRGQAASPSAYNSSPLVPGMLSTTTEPGQRSDNANSEGASNVRCRPGFAFSFLDGPYSPSRPPNEVRRTRSDTSMPEGSTVGNIYKHYMDDEALEDCSTQGSISDLDMTLPEVKPASPSDFNTQKRSHKAPRLSPRGVHTTTSRDKFRSRTAKVARSSPPQFSLPSAPQTTHQKQELASTSSGFAHINSYGNTQELLSLTPGNQPMRDQTSHHSTPNTPKVYIDAGDGNPVMYTGQEEDRGLDQHRLPLEREVSNALRRASAHSVYSTGSMTDSIITRYRHFGQRAYSVSTYHGAFDPQQYAEISPPQGTNSKLAAIVHNPSDQPYTFYDQGVLSSDWVYGPQHNVVRIPISHDLPPQSPRSTPKAYSKPVGGSIAAATDDGNDWETIGTRNSLYGTAHIQAPTLGLIGGTVGRAGSSIADVSDEGLSTMTFEVEDLRSVNRIAQHPAQSGYKVDYRQRSLKDTRAPVFAPQYRIHNVNGFLSNSSRFHPQPSEITQSHLPNLSKHHTNPFKRTPPQVMTTHTPPSSGSSRQNNRYLTTFKPSLRTLNTEIEEEDYTTEIVPPSVFQHLSEQDRKKKALEWMENFDDHKLTLPIHNKESRTPCPDRGSKPSSFYNAVQSAVSNVSGFFSNDGHVSQKNTKLRPLRLVTGNQRNAATKTLSPITPSQIRKTRLKGRLRDLTLVQKLHPQTSQTLSSLGSQIAGSEDFVYRSPLAPPRQRRWKDLYSASQLFGFQEAAKADTLDINGHAHKTSSTTDSTPVFTSQKHLFERPTLRAWSRDEATSTDLTHQKRNCSIAVLCICTMFPPLLLVYIFGGLNGVITWWTVGLYTSYAKSQKRLALIFLVAWSVAVLIGLVVFLALWFSRLR